MNTARILMRSPSESAELQREAYRARKERLKQQEETDCLEEGQKRCFKCRAIKTLDGFYKHPQMADGRLGKCKECCKGYVKDYYVENRALVLQYEKWRNSEDENRKEKTKEYQIRRRAKNPEKYYARTTLNNAVRDGRIKKMPCRICGSVKSQGHHHDYSKPLDVDWLCFKHHREIGHGQKVGL